MELALIDYRPLPPASLEEVRSVKSADVGVAVDLIMEDLRLRSNPPQDNNFVWSQIKKLDSRDYFATRVWNLLWNNHTAELRTFGYKPGY